MSKKFLETAYTPNVHLARYPIVGFEKPVEEDYVTDPKEIEIESSKVGDESHLADEGESNIFFFLASSHIFISN